MEMTPENVEKLLKLVLLNIYLKIDAFETDLHKDGYTKADKENIKELEKFAEMYKNYIDELPTEWLIDNLNLQV